MIIICTHCSMRLKVDDEKVPARSFTLRCPKCQNIVHADPPITSHREDALIVGQSPASGHPRFESPAPPYKLDKYSKGNDVNSDNDTPALSDGNELLRALSAVLKRGTRATDNLGDNHRWHSRRVLICVGEAQRDAVARNVAKSDCQVYVAENKAQAVERMRDERMDVIVLAPDFDPPEHGAAFMTREINALRPAERRRLFFVQLSDTGRTLDAHSAFIQNVNLIVNYGDIEVMTPALERALRDFNDLHRSYNDALGVSPI
jgi:predicted Zn finger-like uncharacterized protein